MAEAPHRATWLPILALTVNAGVWGVSWLPLRALQRYGVHPLWATALVMGLALLAISLWRRGAWRGLWREPLLWGLFLASGISNAGFNWAITVGDVVRVALLFYTMPAWAVLMAWFWLGERPHASTWAQLALALVGVLVVLHTPGNPWPLPSSLADFLALASGCAFAATNTLLRRAGHTAPAHRTWAMFAGGAGVSATVAALLQAQGVVPALPPAGLPWMGLALALGLAFTLGNLCLQYGATRLSVLTTSLVMLSELLFASLSAAAFDAAEISARTLAGGALIVTAAVLAARQDARPNAPGAPA